MTVRHDLVEWLVPRSAIVSLGMATEGISKVENKFFLIHRLGLTAGNLEKDQSCRESCATFAKLMWAEG